MRALRIANPNQLYGTTYLGGEFNNGLVFSLTRASALGWSELVVYPFTGGNDGGGPIGPLTFDANGNIYGTAFNGGTHGAGVVYKLSPNHLTRGWTETVLYSFQGTPFGTSADGANPNGGVIFGANGNLYGTTQFGGEGQGGGCGCGTAFELTPNANGTWSESVLYALRPAMELIRTVRSSSTHAAISMWRPSAARQTTGKRQSSLPPPWVPGQSPTCIYSGSADMEPA